MSKVRILVGINVDHLISEAAKKSLEFNLNSKVTIEEFINTLKADVQSAKYDKDIEEGILQFITDGAKEKIEIKAHPDKNIHAKIYILRQEIEHEHAGFGSVITGSSNLTEEGVEKNFEFNVELSDYDDLKFALSTFENLWEEAVPVLSAEVGRLKTETFLNNEYTPFEIYIKLLSEYFRMSIESELTKNAKNLTIPSQV